MVFKNIFLTISNLPLSVQFKRLINLKFNTHTKVSSWIWKSLRADFAFCKQIFCYVECVWKHVLKKLAKLRWKNWPNCGEKNLQIAMKKWALVEPRFTVNNPPMDQRINIIAFERPTHICTHVHFHAYNKGIKGTSK